MYIDRIYTLADQDPLQNFPLRPFEGGDGMTYMVPASWSETACGILAEKIFHKRALPVHLHRTPEANLPEWLQSSAFSEEGYAPEPRFEDHFFDVLHRVAGGLCYHAFRAGIFSAEEEAKIFYDEMRYMLAHQVISPEVSLWATAGIAWAYGTEAVYVPAERLAKMPADFSRRPLPLSAVTVGPEDDRPETAKYLKLLAGISSLDADTQGITATLPIENRESLVLSAVKDIRETDNIARHLGYRTLEETLHRIMDSCDRDDIEAGFDPGQVQDLECAITAARQSGVSEGAIARALHYARQGFENAPIYTPDENASPDNMGRIDIVLSIPDSFIEASITGHGFMVVEAGKPHHHGSAADMMHELGIAIWSGGDPGVLFRDAAEAASPLPAAAMLGRGKTGGLLFAGDTEAPSATINLLQLGGDKGQVVDHEKLSKAVTIAMIMLEASFSFTFMAEGSVSYRPVVLSHAGLAPLLMRKGIAYDSDAGRASAALISALVSGTTYHASAMMADKIGACDGYAPLAKKFLQNVTAKKASLSGKIAASKSLAQRQQIPRISSCPDKVVAALAENIWDKAYSLGKVQGFRHVHMTGLGTDVDTQGLLDISARNIEIENSLVTEEAETGNRQLRDIVTDSLKDMGYSEKQISEISAYILGCGSLAKAPHINHASLHARGFTTETLTRLESTLKTARDIRHVFTPWTLGLHTESDDMLETLGFTEEEIRLANIHCCGAMTSEGAPHLSAAHAAAFQTEVTVPAQMQMQAAVEYFLCGGVAHRIIIPHEKDIDDVRSLIMKGWEWGLKTLQIYRSGCSLLHAVTIPFFQEKPAEKLQESRILPKKAKSAI
jgi:ribonucleoside-diphosphate reductase alpha chain